MGSPSPWTKAAEPPPAGAASAGIVTFPRKQNPISHPGSMPDRRNNDGRCHDRTHMTTTKRPDEARAQQIKDMKWGMFICWSFSSFSGQEWTPTLDKDASYFKATGCDTDQWCETAKAAGMSYVLFLTKHHDGFCLWDTDTTEKKVTKSPLGIDVLAKLKKSCDRHGLKLALYFSEGDWNWPGAKDGEGNQKWGGSHPEMKKAQLKELLTNYGPIEFWWMDHATGTGGLSHAETVEWIHNFSAKFVCWF
jgi:alpha-L-fucosidase